MDNINSLEVLEAAKQSIVSNEDYIKASEMLKLIKKHKNNIVDYWKESKRNAKSAYDTIVRQESEMLEECSQAEKIIKQNISGFIDNKYSKAFLETKMLTEKEADNLLDKAIITEKEGDAATAEILLSQAETLENMQSNVDIAIPKVDGITAKKSWKCRVIDESLVPILVNEFEIRPVDTKKALEVRKKYPNISIPGVQFYQETVISVKT